MTDQHRATPEQISMCVYPGDLATDPRKVAVVINAISDRIEALEAAQLEQAESHRFCTDAIVRRVEALEATQHVHADVLRLSDAERERLTQELAKLAAVRPLETETTYGSDTAADAAQILRAPMVVQGTFEHGGETYRFKAKPEREAPMTELRAASAEARPTVKESLTDGGSLLEMVAKAIYNVPHDSAAEASAAIREVATWLDRFALHGSGEYAQAAKVLRQEANHG